MNIIISGALGHMGREVARMAAERDDKIVAGVDPADGAAAFLLYHRFANIPEDIAAEADALIDFSSPEGLLELADWVQAHQMPVVLATTGYTEKELERVQTLSEKTAVFRSANMSYGIAVMRRLVREAARALGGYDIELVEMHHRRKKDAPSGTALMLAEAAQEGAGALRQVCGRQGRDCRREAGDIGMQAVRGGTIAGEHEVLFLGESERITLHHTAENRGVFASGALKAAAFLVGKAPGMYDMDDILNETGEVK